MQSIKEILISEKWFSDIICRDLYQDLKFYNELRWRHQGTDIEELCIDICKGIKKEIEWHTKYWLELVEKIERRTHDSLCENSIVQSRTCNHYDKLS